MMMKNLAIHKKDLSLSLFLLIISYSIFTFNLEGQRWDGDEIFFNSGGAVYFDLIKNGDLFHPCWYEGEGDNKCKLLHMYNWHWPIHAGHISSIIVGFSQYISGFHDHDWYATSFWNTNSWDWENLLTPSEFAAGRTLSPVFGSVTLVFAYFIGKLIFNRYVGFIFSITLLFHGLWLVYSRIAMTEVYVSFFSLSSILFLLYSVKKENGLRLKYFILSSVLFGISLDTKLSSVFLIFLVIFLILFRHSFNERIHLSKIKKYLPKNSLFVILYIIILISTLFITNPYYYPDPFGRLFELYEGSSNYLLLTKPSLENDNMFRTLVTIHTTIIPYFSNYYDFDSDENFSSLTHLQWTSPHTYTSIPVSLFFIVGFFYLIQRIKNKIYSFSKLIPIIWFVSIFIITILTVREFNAERFYLPIFFPIILISAYGLWRFLEKFPKKIKAFFSILFLFSHLITTMIFWEIIYYSNGIRQDVPMKDLTLQNAFQQPFVIFSYIVFVIVFVVLLFYKNKIKNERGVRKETVSNLDQS